MNAKIKDEYKIKKGRRTLVPGFFDGEYFTPCDKFTPGMVSPLAKSNSYVMVSEECDSLKSDSYVKAIPTKFAFTSKRIVDLVSKPR